MYLPENMLGQRFGENITLEQGHATIQQFEPGKQWELKNGQKVML